MTLRDNGGVPVPSIEEPAAVPRHARLLRAVGAGAMAGGAGLVSAVIGYAAVLIPVASGIVVWFAVFHHNRVARQQH